MEQDLEQRILAHPEGAEEQAAVRCLLRLRSEGKSLDEISAGVKADTGLDLSTAAVDRVLRHIAGPVPRETGGDPEYFNGYLGGG